MSAPIDADPIGQDMNATHVLCVTNPSRSIRIGPRTQPQYAMASGLPTTNDDQGQREF